jgi:hypothetical protein
MDGLMKKINYLIQANNLFEAEEKLAASKNLAENTADDYSDGGDYDSYDDGDDYDDYYDDQDGYRSNPKSSKNKASSKPKMPTLSDKHSSLTQQKFVISENYSLDFNYSHYDLKIKEIVTERYKIEYSRRVFQAHRSIFSKLGSRAKLQATQAT